MKFTKSHYFKKQYVQQINDYKMVLLLKRAFFYINPFETKV